LTGPSPLATLAATVSEAQQLRILHVDGDTFFASCEIAMDASLSGRPVWVGGGRTGDGIVIAANRLAKRYGIKTGTACFEAKRLCPQAILAQAIQGKLTPQNPNDEPATALLKRLHEQREAESPPKRRKQMGAS